MSSTDLVPMRLAQLIAQLGELRAENEKLREALDDARPGVDRFLAENAKLAEELLGLKRSIRDEYIRGERKAFAIALRLVDEMRTPPHGLSKMDEAQRSLVAFHLDELARYIEYHRDRTGWIDDE